MAKILVLYYSSYGHVETLAEAVLDGARSVPGSEAVLKRVPELLPRDAALAAGFKLDQPALVAVPDELVAYDAVIFGTPTRFGAVSAQMKSFLDQTGALWMKGALIGKLAGVFVSTATQHGGQEATILSLHASLLHHGMILVGLPYAFQGQMRLDEVTGCSPYGASTIAGVDGSRRPSANELEGARFQGRHVAETARALLAGRMAV